jgi:hypothetical protein
MAREQTKPAFVCLLRCARDDGPREVWSRIVLHKNERVRSYAKRENKTEVIIAKYAFTN